MRGTTKVKYENGNEYVGKTKDGLPDGNGTMKYPNGSVYTGGWKKGKMHGYGTCNWVNGDVYEGQYVNGMKHGKGELKLANNGDVYDGNWENAKMRLVVALARLLLALALLFALAFLKQSVMRVPKAGAVFVLPLALLSLADIFRWTQILRLESYEFQKNAHPNSWLFRPELMKVIKTEPGYEQPTDDEGNDPTNTNQYEKMKADVKALKSELAKEKSLRESMQAQIEALQRNSRVEN